MDSYRGLRYSPKQPVSCKKSRFFLRRFVQALVTSDNRAPERSLSIRSRRYFLLYLALFARLARISSGIGLYCVHFGFQQFFGGLLACKEAGIFKKTVLTWTRYLLTEACAGFRASSAVISVQRSSRQHQHQVA